MSLRKSDRIAVVLAMGSRAEDDLYRQLKSV